MNTYQELEQQLALANDRLRMQEEMLAVHRANETAIFDLLFPHVPERNGDDGLPLSIVGKVSKLVDQINAVHTAVKPVHSWYNDDEHPDRPISEVVALAVEDIQADRERSLESDKISRAIREELLIVQNNLSKARGSRDDLVARIMQGLEVPEGYTPFDAIREWNRKCEHAAATVKRMNDLLTESNRRNMECEIYVHHCTSILQQWREAVVDNEAAGYDGVAQADEATDKLLKTMPEVRHPIIAAFALHATLLETNPYAYFELSYTRQTGWMLWICDKNKYVPQEPVHPDRKVLYCGQGSTPHEAASNLTPKT